MLPILVIEREGNTDILNHAQITDAQSMNTDTVCRLCAKCCVLHTSCQSGPYIAVADKKGPASQVWFDHIGLR